MLVWATALLIGCTQQDENPEWNPKANLPSWAYDAPFYYRPTEDLKVAETLDPGIPVYYSKQEYFFIQHPVGYQVTGVPRLAVYCSVNEGKDWERCGFFGAEQTHFLYKAQRDGRHWIRFVGPGQGIAETPPGVPHRIYVVDTKGPQIHISVRPPLWEDQEKKIPRTYRPGQTVTFHWAIHDKNLDPASIKRGTCFARFPSSLVWSPLPQTPAARGKDQLDIPAEAAAQGGMRFRVEAKDKAGNITVAFTDVLRVSGSRGSPPPPPSHTPEQIAAAMAASRPDPRPGWPDTGTLLRGGSSQVLRWLPKAADKHQNLALQFTSNNGRSWRTLAEGFRSGEEIKWTVPDMTSKNCRLRVVSVQPGPKPEDDPLRYLLVMSQRFTLDTVTPGIVLPDPGKPPPLVPNQE
jgi:hypothetical protein